MNIVVLSVGDALDVRKWSGSTLHIVRELMRVSDKISFIGARPLETGARSLNRLAKILGFYVEVRHSTLFARISGLWCWIALARRRADVVVAITASAYVAYLKTDKPIIYISDATFSSIEKMLPEFGLLPSWLIKQASLLETLSFKKATLIVYPSTWARDSAVRDYGVPADKILVTPFGANLPVEVLASAVAPKRLPDAGPLNILYISVDWEGKRGDLVVDTVRALSKKGIAAKAFLVGRVPKHVISDDLVEVVGYLSKNDPDHMSRFLALFTQAHLFMLPTTGDCYGIVFSEAQAFATPSLTFSVGGTPSAVLDGRTGFVLPLGSSAEDFVGRIEELLADPRRYTAMSAAGRRRFEDEANWTVFVERVLAALPTTEKVAARSDGVRGSTRRASSREVATLGRSTDEGS